MKLEFHTMGESRLLYTLIRCSGHHTIENDNTL